MTATENFARGVQGRFAAISAMGTASALFADSSDSTHLLETWARIGAYQNQSQISAGGTSVVSASGGPLSGVVNTSVALLPTYQRGTPGDERDLNRPGSDNPEGALRYRLPAIGMVDMVIEDESARINLNVAGSLANRDTDTIATTPELIDLKAFIEAALRDQGVAAGSAASLARNIVLWRCGSDGQPGEAGVDDDGDSVDTDLSNNGIDDDGNGVIDDARERMLGLKYNGIDDNGNGDIDDELECVEFDGADNDGDGVIDEIREGIDEPDEFESDPRLAPRGDDRRYERVSDLLRVPGMTTQIYEILAPLMTTHSMSETTAGGQDSSRALVDVNRADYDEILAQLEDHFPDVSEDWLVQFTLNIIDARDGDSIPSRPPNTSLENTPLGVERTPLINEVWPDSETSAGDGDDGQYIEIINPYSETIDLTGWTLRVGQRPIALGGNLQAHATLIVTDDFDESLDSEPEDDFAGYGSLFEIFGRSPNGSSRVLIVDPMLEIPNSAGTIQLRDNEGNLIDWFQYQTPSSMAGRRLSFQRNDPRVRIAETALCSPWEANRNCQPTEEFQETYSEVMPLDQPFTTPADLMFVFAGWEGSTDQSAKLWYYPPIHSEEIASLDSTLVDIFSVGPLHSFPEPEPEVADDSESETLTEDEIEEEQFLERLPQTAGYELAMGQINVNTAPWAVLQALPGVDENMADRIIDWRENVAEEWLDDRLDRVAPFQARGDLLRNSAIWGDTPLKERLLTYRRFVNAVATSSGVCRVEATAATEPGRRTPSTSPRSITAAVEVTEGRSGLVTLDFQRGSR